jgi:hypothetical protein
MVSAQELERVLAREDVLLRQYDNSDRIYLKLENRDYLSYFHQRIEGEAIVEKNFIRYIFDARTKELLEDTVEWRADLPAQVTPAVPREVAEAMVDGEPLFSKLYVISPKSDVYALSPVPEHACWVVRSRDNDTLVVTIIDTITGAKLGYGIPPPYRGFAFHCDEEPGWQDWRDNAADWFTEMGYGTTTMSCPCDDDVQSEIQSDMTIMFYELSHGGSWSFHQGCSSCSDVTALEIETWIESYASMPFTFLGSCEGMCDQSDDHLSHEFRKGTSEGTVTVGYCNMDDLQCDTCWGDSIDWQTALFDWMNRGYTMQTSFNHANATVPTCAGTNNCMRIGGDTGMRFIPNVGRSLCGYLPVVPDPYILTLRHKDRDYYIRCDVVSTGNGLLIDPHVDLIFLNDSKLIGAAPVTADATSGEIRFVSEQDTNRGMKLISGELNAMNGGQVKVYE